MKCIKGNIAIYLLSLFIFAPLFFQESGVFVHAAANKEEITITDGIYNFEVLDEKKRTLQFIGCNFKEETTEINIPGKVMYKEREYTVTDIFIKDYYEYNPVGSSIIKPYYDKVSVITFPDTVTGTIGNNLIYAFTNTEMIVFEGKTPPIIGNYTFEMTKKNIRFVVPEGLVDTYSEVLLAYVSCYNGWDATERDIPIKPTITTTRTEVVEPPFFLTDDGLTYTVLKYAGNSGIGEVRLITNNWGSGKDRSYLALPSEVTNDKYRYKVTSLGFCALYNCGAKIIVVPDTVTHMEGGVFDQDVEYLFLSKNCKEIPRMITDEGSYTKLRFVYMPEGVTTIKDEAFYLENFNSGSIIVPKTVKSIGANALYAFNTVTFPWNTPIAGLHKAVRQGTTVKVPKAKKSKYTSALKSVKKLKFENAKVLTLTEQLDIQTKSFTIKKGKSKTLKAALTKGSNETIFWASSNTKIFKISKAGVLKAEGKGTAYVFAYTRTSGFYDVIKVTVTK